MVVDVVVVVATVAYIMIIGVCVCSGYVAFQGRGPTCVCALQAGARVCVYVLFSDRRRCGGGALVGSQWQASTGWRRAKSRIPIITKKRFLLTPVAFSMPAKF